MQKLKFYFSEYNYFTFACFLDCERISHIVGIKMTLTSLALDPAPAYEEVWKVHELHALSSWTYSELITVKHNNIYTFLHRGTEKPVTVAPLHQCSELYVRKTNLKGQQ